MVPGPHPRADRVHTVDMLPQANAEHLAPSSKTLSQMQLPSRDQKVIIMCVGGTLKIKE